MSITVSVTSQSPASVRAGLLAVPVDGDKKLGAGADAVDDALGGTLKSFMAEAGFSGKPGETLSVPADGLAAGVALLVGVGDAKSVDAAALRRAAAAVARRANKVSTVATTLASAAAKGTRRGRGRAGASPRVCSSAPTSSSSTRRRARPRS